MAANPSELLALNCCLSSYTEKELQAMTIQLLASLASMAADPTALLALNCCLASGYNEKQLQAMTVQLLQGVIDTTPSGVETAPLTVGAGAPVAAGTALAPLYWDSTGAQFYVWDGSAWNIH